jgi:hypothetical protein
MASVPARRFGGRLLRTLPRVVLAIMFGVIIAEPLLLGIFHTAIEQQVRQDRTDAVQQRESDLRTCNPVPGTPEAAEGKQNDPKCDGLRLGITTDSEAKQAELDDDKKQAADLKATIDKDSQAYADLEQKAREECNGTSGPGLTGKVGQGPNCKRLRAEADQYRADHRIDENNAKLADLNDQIATLTTEVGDSRSTAAQRIDDGIKAKVDEYRKDQAKEIGLLERLKALSELVDHGGYIRYAEWGLRLFFIGVDALPVLLKFLSGVTAYDNVVADRVARQQRAEKAVSETRRRRSVIQQELERHQLHAEVSSARTKIDFDARVRYGDLERVREEMTEMHTAHLLAEQPTLTIHPHDGQP